MLNFLEQIDLLENFALAKIILHVLFLDCLDRNAFTRQLVHTESYLTEGPFSNEFDELVKLKCRGGQLVVLSDVILDVADELVSFLQ